MNILTCIIVILVTLAVVPTDAAIVISVHTNSTCVGGTVQLKCKFPSLDTRTTAGYFKYISSSPDWKENGRFLKLSDSGYTSSLLSSTEATLTISSTDIEDTRNYSCLLFLNNGQGHNGGIEESNHTPVIRKKLSQPNVTIIPEQRQAMMLFNHIECSNMVRVTVSNTGNGIVYDASKTNLSNITVPELEPATIYKAQVVAMNELTSMTTTTNFTTKPAPPVTIVTDGIDALSIGVATGTAFIVLALLSLIFFSVMCWVFCSRSTRLKCMKCNKVGRTDVETIEDKGLALKEDI